MTTRYNRTEKPKRCLTAYNYFFQHQRERLLEAIPEKTGNKPKRSHGKIGFQDLARAVSLKWKSVTAEEKQYFLDLAKKDKERYMKEMDEWRATLEQEYQDEINREEAAAAFAAPVTSIATNTEVPSPPVLSSMPVPLAPPVPLVQPLPLVQPMLTMSQILEPTPLPEPVPHFRQYQQNAHYVSTSEETSSEESWAAQQQEPQLNASADDLLMCDIPANFWDINDPPQVNDATVAPSQLAFTQNYNSNYNSGFNNMNSFFQ